MWLHLLWNGWPLEASNASTLGLDNIYDCDCTYIYIYSNVTYWGSTPLGHIGGYYIRDLKDI